MSTSGNPIPTSFQADFKKEKKNLLVGFSLVLLPPKLCNSMKYKMEENICL